MDSLAYDSFSAYSKHVHLEILAAVPHADYSLQHCSPIRCVNEA